MEAERQPRPPSYRLAARSPATRETGPERPGWGKGSLFRQYHNHAQRAGLHRGPSLATVYGAATAGLQTSRATW
jgi:hypothetical protein